MFNVYVLYSPSYNKIYIGFTSDLENRLRSHNMFASKGWTIKFRPWEILFTENFETKTEAMKREKQLKSAKGRNYIWQAVKDRLNI